MPYPSIADAKKANFPTVLDGANLTIGQVNKLAEIYDAIKGQGKVDEPMAVAVKSWKQLYKKEADAWTKIKATDFDEEMLVMSPEAVEIIEAMDNVQILPLGEWKGHNKGPFKITKEVISKMAENFKKGGRDRVLDYEHSTLTGKKAPAAGWIKSVWEGGLSGLMAKVEWTAEAKEYIAKKQYRFLSPVFTMNRKDKTTGENTGPYLHSVALTNDPFLDQIMPLVNKSFVDIQPITIISNKEELIMLATIKKILKLKDEATDEEITTALTDLQKAKTPEKIDELLGLDKNTGPAEVKAALALCSDALKELGLDKDAGIDEIKEKIVALKDEGKVDEKDFVPAKDFKALEKQITARDERIEFIETKLAKQKQESLRKWACEDEKIVTPAMWTEWGEDMSLKDPDGFEKIVKTMPPAINTEKISGELKVNTELNDKADAAVKEMKKEYECSDMEAMVKASEKYPHLFKDALE